MNIVQPIRDPQKLELMKQHLKQISFRDYILFMIGINTGFRISDILSLKVGDVKGDHIEIIESKTGKHKKVSIRKTLRKELDAFVRGKHDDEYLFTGRSKKKLSKIKGTPITTSAAYKMLGKVAQKFNLDNIGTHSMRKTFGYHFYKRKKDIALLMELFNHSEESITLRYVGILQDTLDEALDTFEL
jgi:integrase